MVKILLPASTQLEEYTFEQLEKIFKIEYLPVLAFHEAKVKASVEKRCQKALEKEQFEIRQKWLGSFFGPQVIRGHCPDISIRWIDEKIGYGVFTEVAFAPGALIGEYTGSVRKRKWSLDRKNDYCFDYSIGEKRTPFIIDASMSGNHTRFINHDEHANLEPIAVYYEGAVHILLIATKDIAKGEQLCYDYGKSYWKKRKQPQIISSS